MNTPIQCLSHEEKERIKRDIKHKLNIYNSKINVMSILCSKSANYNSKFKNIITICLIVFSFSSALLSGLFPDDNNIRIPIIVLNSLSAFFIGVDRSYRFSEKMSNFLKYSQNYNKLSHDLDKAKTINSDYLNSIITLYDNITDSISDEFPSCIIEKMKKEYKDLELLHLPLILQNHFTPMNNSFIKKNIDSDIVIST